MLSDDEDADVQLAVVDKMCRIVDCTRKASTIFKNGRWQSRLMCDAHLKRADRFGSPTARACYRCHAVVDSQHDETHIIDSHKIRFHCSNCLMNLPALSGGRHRIRRRRRHGEQLLPE